MPTISASKEPFVITPHPDAPILSNRDDAQLHLKHLFTEMTSSNPNLYGEVIDLIREAGLINLFFFLKTICAYSGPYDRLTDHLHLDMCNFRQLNHFEGARAAGAIPRGFYKSTIFSHGADTWILNRDPNQRIAIVNAIVDKAYDFYRIVRSNFEENELFQFLYPHNAVQPGKAAFVLPSRERNWPEPSLKVIGATGAAEGGHYTGLNIDDLIGLDELDKEYKANANMMQKIKWAQTNTRALLDSATRSWIMWVFTLYTSDDVYHQMILDKNMSELIGYQDPDMVAKVNPLIPDGKSKYSVYYRCIIEDNEAIFKEEGFTKEWYESLLEENKWTAMAQYMNKPASAGMVEFYAMPVKRCMIRFDHDKGEWFIVRYGHDTDNKQADQIPLRNCDVVMSIDPAGTDTGITAKTSRTSIGIWAKDSKNNVYRIWSAVGYYNIDQMFDKVFDGHKLYRGYVRGTFVESNAMQKILAPLLMKEQKQRGVYINPQPVYAKGDKVARIRSTLGWYLSQGKVWMADGYGNEFIEEKDIFPMSEYKRDVLDESEKALTILSKPMSEEERFDYEEQDYEYESHTTNNCVGY